MSILRRLFGGGHAPADEDPIEAPSELERDDSVALVLVGDVDLLPRRSFHVVLLASDALPDAEEVIPELSDLAVAHGLQAKFVPA